MADITVPYTFASRTSALASEVNANFTAIAQAALPESGGTMVGHLLFTDNTYDIGASGATRPRTGYFGTSVVTPALSVSGTGATAITVGGGITAGSGVVGIVGTSGKIPAISSTYFTSLSGANLTSLNASNLGSGTVPDARLSANVPLLNASSNAFASSSSSVNVLSATATDDSTFTGNVLKVGSYRAASSAFYLAKFNTDVDGSDVMQFGVRGDGRGFLGEGLLVDYQTTATDSSGLIMYAGNGSSPRIDYWTQDISGSAWRLARNIAGAGEVISLTVGSTGALTSYSTAEYGVTAESTNTGTYGGLRIKHDKADGGPILAFADNAGDVASIYWNTTANVLSISSPVTLYVYGTGNDAIVGVSTSTGTYGGLTVVHDKTGGKPRVAFGNNSGELGYIYWDPATDRCVVAGGTGGFAVAGPSYADVGSVSAPAFSFYAAPTYGMYQATNQLGLVAGDGNGVILTAGVPDHFSPQTDGDVSLGDPSYKWGTLYCSSIGTAGSGGILSLVLADGSVSDPVLSFASSATTGLFYDPTSGTSFNLVKGGQTYLSLATALTANKALTCSAALIVGLASYVNEQSSTPATPTAGSQCCVYMKADKLVVMYDDAGTVRYKYLTLTGTDATWTHATSAP